MGILDDVLNTSPQPLNPPTKKRSTILDDLIDTGNDTTPEVKSTPTPQPQTPTPSTPKRLNNNPIRDVGAEFLSGFRKTPEKTSVVPASQELMKQYDGKMVPKGEARNKYGALIYGGSLGVSQEDTTPVKTPESISDMGRFTLDAIKYRIEQGTNLRDNLKYEQKISTKPIENTAIQTVGKDIKSTQKRETAIQEGMATPDVPSEWVQSNILKYPVLSEIYKGVKRGGRKAGESGTTGLQLVADTFDIPVMESIASWAEDQARFYTKEIARNQWESPSSDIKSFTEGGYKDPRYYASNLSEIVPQFAMALGLTIVAKKPLAGITVGYTQESGQAYNDLIDRGIAPSDARSGAMVYGAIASMLEGVNFVKYSNKLLGNTVSHEVKQSWKQAVKETLVEGGIDLLKEGVTEGAQQFSQNVMTRFYDKNQDLFEGVIDSTVIGALGGAGYASIGLGKTLSEQSNSMSESLKSTYSELRGNVAKARDITNGTTPASREESIIAQSIMMKYEQKVKDTVISVPGDTSVTVDTIAYDDGYSAIAEATVNGNTTTINTRETYKTKEQAIQKSLETLGNNVPEAQSITARPLEELLALKNTVPPWDESSIFTPEEIKILDNTQKTYDDMIYEKKKGDILREYESSYQNEMTYPEFAKKKLIEINEVYDRELAQIAQEIDNAQAGYRNFVYNTDSPGSTITGIPSTFPKWIPEELRDKKLMEKTFAMITESSIIPPRNTRMRKLADVYLQRIDPNFFLYEGESARAIDGGGVRSKVEKDGGVGRDKNSTGNRMNEGTRSSRPTDAPNNQKGNRDESTRGGVSDSKGQYQSYVESDGIGNTEARSTEKTEAFKLAERMREIIKNLNTNYTRYVAKGSKGTFYTESGNIAINSVNDVDTVHHELSHLIDVKQGVTNAYVNDEKIIDELTKIYLQYYPEAEAGHDLDLRMKEGYAVLQQKYLTHPTRISESYPLLVETFVKNGHILQQKLNSDMQKLVSDYQGLSDTDKIGAILTDTTRNTDANTFLNTAEKIEQYTSDVVIPFVKLQEQSKGNIDVANILYANKAVNGRVFKNLDRNGINFKETAKNKSITYDHDFWHFNEKQELEKKFDYNWGSLIWEVGQTHKMDEFSEWLIARDQVGQYERLDRMNARISRLSEGVSRDELIKRRDEVVAYLKANEQILPRDLVERVHENGRKQWKEYAKKFDAMLGADIEFLHSVGTLSDDHYEAIKNSYGYAPIRRTLDDGIVGANNTELQISGFKIPKAKQLKGRDGGTMEIVNPLLGAIQNHVEAMQKGYRQLALNRVYDLMGEWSQFAQIIDPVISIVNGIPTYTTPQGKPLTMDENIIVKMDNGIPKPMVLAGELIETIQSVFNPRPRSGIEQTIVGATQLFTKGTTGIYIPFFLTNLLRDQWSAVAHTKNGYIPVYSQLKELLPIALKREGANYEYMKEYLALGGHQNLLKWNEATGQQILEHLTEGQKGWRKWMTYLGKGVDILAIPANLSETGTRVVEYIKSRKAGKSMWQAMEDAGQLTAPFHHQGRVMDSEYGRGYIRSIPFFSATIQGMSQWIRTARTAEGKKHAGGVFLSVTVGILGSLVASWELGDDEDKKALLDMDPGQFGKFIFLPKGGGEFYKIPIPQEIGAVGAMFGMMINEMYGDARYTPKEYLSTATSWIPDQINITDPGKAVLAMMPTLLKPTAEVTFNRKTFPNVSPIESQSMQRLPSEFRYNQATSDFAKWLGQTELGKGLDMSPVKIDHFLTGQFGRAVGYATGKETAVNPLKSLEQSRFFTSGRMIQSYYDEKEYITEQITASSKGLIPLTEEQIIDLKARKKMLDGVSEALLEYTSEEKKGASEDTLIPMRAKIWNDINTYFEKGVEVTELDRLKYQKQKEQEQWKDDRMKLMDKYLAMPTDKLGSKTAIENEIRKEISDKAKANAFIKELRVLRDYKTDTDVRKIWDADTNDEKLLIFKEMKSRRNDYDTIKRTLRADGLISDPLWKELSKQDR